MSANHMRFARCSALLAALSLALAAPAPVAAQGGRTARALDAYIERALHDWRVPGAAIAVVRNDSVVLLRGYGVRELGKPAPVDAQTIFGIASTTKAFTAAALAMLVDSGRLSWDDRVTKFLPGFQVGGPYVTREVTVRDLLTHRTGLPRGDRLWYLSGFDRAEVLHRARFLEPRWSFRAHYSYQNIMFIAAGQVVGAASGSSWDDFVRTRIFQPLGMTNSSTSIRALAGQPDVAMPHQIIHDTVRVIPWRDMDDLGGAGAINSSARDLAQWLRLQLGHGTYAGRRLLSDSVMDEMHTPQIVIPRGKETRALFPDTHFLTYGLAWDLRDYHGRELDSHEGAIDGMRTAIGLVPELHLGVVVLANLDETNFVSAILYRALDAYMGAPPRDWSALMLAAAKKARAADDSTRRAFEAARTSGTRPSLPLARYAGTYTDSLYGPVTVSDSGGRMVVRFGPDFTGDAEHWQYDTFKVTWRDPALGDDYITFGLDARGAATSLRIRDLDQGEFGRAAAGAGP